MKGAVRKEVFLLGLVCLIFLPGLARADTPYAGGPGTVQHALGMPDGAGVSLAAVVVGRVDPGGRHSVHEWWDEKTTVTLLFDPPPVVNKGQTIDAEGWMTTLPDGTRAVRCERIGIYINSSGGVAESLPPLKGVLPSSVWPPKKWIDVTWDEKAGEASALEGAAAEEPMIMESLTVETGTIPWAKTLADEATLPELQGLMGKIVTAGTGQFVGCIYIEEPNRSSGIRVEPTGGTFVPGNRVNVTAGTLRTTLDGERYIDDAAVSLVDNPGELRPIGVRHRELGGGPFTDGQTVFQQGVLAGFGTNTIGLFMRILGTVTAVYPVQKCFYVDDGSALDDTTHSGVLGVRVSWALQEISGTNPEVTPPQPGRRVSLTGISGTKSIGGPKPIRTLQLRAQSDVAMVDPDIHDWPTFMHDPHHTGRSTAVDNRGGTSDPNDKVTLYLRWMAEVPTATSLIGRYLSMNGKTIPDHYFEQPNAVAHPQFDSSPVHYGWGSPTNGTMLVGTFEGVYEGNVAYPVRSTGQLLAFNPLAEPSQWSGAIQPVWTYPAGTGRVGGIASTPAVAKTATGQTVIVFGCDGRRLPDESHEGGRVYGLNPDGTLRWSYPENAPGHDYPAPGNRVGRILCSSAAVLNGVIYIGTESDELIALDLDTGGLRFKRVLDYLNRTIDPNPLLGLSSPAAVRLDGEDYVFIGSDDGYVYKVGGADHPTQAGHVVASFQTGRCMESSPSYYAGKIYIGSTPATEAPEPRVHCRSAADLSQIWAGSYPGAMNEVRATPALCDQGVYVGDETGTYFYRFALDAVNPPENQRLDQAECDGHVFSSAGLSSALAYVGNDGGSLLAFNLTNFTLANKLALKKLENNEWVDMTSPSLDNYLGGWVSSSPAISYSIDASGNMWLFVTRREWTGFDEEGHKIVLGPPMLYCFGPQP